MTDERIRVVRQWLGSTSQLQEGMLTLYAHRFFFSLFAQSLLPALHRTNLILSLK